MRIASDDDVRALPASAAGGCDAPAHETPSELLQIASVVTCDSRAQARAYQEPFFADELIDLGDVVAGRVPGRRGPEEITVHCSVGLAGSEVALAARLFDERRGRRRDSRRAPVS